MNLDKENLESKRRNKNYTDSRTDLKNKKLFEITYKRVISGKAKHLTRNIYNSLLF
jgi:hypothetical protein